jgi:hypothetical protein
MLLINLGVIRANCIGSASCHTHEAELKLSPTDDLTRGNVIGRVAQHQFELKVPGNWCWATSCGSHSGLMVTRTPWLNRIFSSAAVLAQIC